MILIDYSQVSLATILSFKNELNKSQEEVKDLIRHIVLSTILNYKKKYGSQYGNIVICCDGRKYWRKEVFPYYKGDRKKNREKSDFDWKLIFEVLDQMRADLREFFPYKVIHLDRAEADDVIAILTEWSQTNELVQDGLYERPQKNIIISSDHDFLQLQKYEGVAQFSPNTKKLIKMSHKDLYVKYITHIVKAGDDGIPNILSKDDVLVTEGVRQTPMSAKRLEEFIEQGKDACRNDDERRNWDRNETLVSFAKIPEDIREGILSEYIKGTQNIDRMRIMSYLIKNKCRLLLNSLEEF